MKKSIDFAMDDHPSGDPDRSPVAWVVAVVDDCEGCDDIRVELTLEEEGRAGAGVVAHLAPAMARRVRTAIGVALREVGESPGA